MIGIPKWDALVSAQVGLMEARLDEAVEELRTADARMRRWKARLRWRAAHKRDYATFSTERLAFRAAYCGNGLYDEGHREWRRWHDDARNLPMAGPKGVLP